MTAARALKTRGYQVELIESRPDTTDKMHNEQYNALLEQLKQENIVIKQWPYALEISGSPGSYQITRKPGGKADRTTAGAILIDVQAVNSGNPSLWETTSFDGVIKRLLERRIHLDPHENARHDLLRSLTIRDTTGIFLTNNGFSEPYNDPALNGLAAAARVAAFIDKGSIIPRTTSVIINEQLCRSCGNCSDICPYIEMRERVNGTTFAYIDSALCLGCGACVANCPTGAITQPSQSNKQIVSTLRALLQQGKATAEVY
jgi:ferredoxin